MSFGQFLLIVLAWLVAGLARDVLSVFVLERIRTKGAMKGLLAGLFEPGAIARMTASMREGSRAAALETPWHLQDQDGNALCGDGDPFATCAPLGSTLPPGARLCAGCANECRAHYVEHWRKYEDVPFAE